MAQNAFSTTKFPTTCALFNAFMDAQNAIHPGDTILALLRPCQVLLRIYTVETATLCRVKIRSATATFAQYSHRNGEENRGGLRPSAHPFSRCWDFQNSSISLRIVDPLGCQNTYTTAQSRPREKLTKSLLTKSMHDTARQIGALCRGIRALHVSYSLSACFGHFGNGTGVTVNTTSPRIRMRDVQRSYEWHAEHRMHAKISSVS